MLPNKVLPNGFLYHPAWEEDWACAPLAEVQDAIPWRHEPIRVFGREVLQPRLTAWMGDKVYTYSGKRHEPSKIPEPVARIKRFVEGLLGLEFNSVLANLYRDGQDSVAWHADDEPELGDEPVIASVSLGGRRRFGIRHNESGERLDLWLKHADLLVMRGRSQKDFQHCVPKTAKQVQPRINLTFRHVF